jgi:hypothetical protein
LTGVAYRLQQGRAPAEVAAYVDRVSGQQYAIVEVIQLTPDQMTSLQRHLRSVSTTSESDNFCGHEPGFAVVLSRGAKVVYEAGYCFKCDTIGRPRKSGSWARLAMKKAPDALDQFKTFLQSAFSDSNKADGANPDSAGAPSE